MTLGFVFIVIIALLALNVFALIDIGVTIDKLVKRGEEDDKENKILALYN